MFHVERPAVPDLTDRAFVEAAGEAGVALDRAQCERLWAYEGLLKAWSERVRLVSRGDRDHVRQRHLLDCLSASPHLSPAPCRLLDLGSGAGLPGIVLHVARPGQQTVLLESARMKVLFLRHVREELGLDDLEVVHGRAESEEVLNVHEGRYGCVTVRAVGSLDRIWELSRPFLTPSGQMAAFKGPDALDEMAAADTASLRIDERSIEVPGLGRPRTLVLVGQPG